MSPIKTIMISGFLGAGKTSLLSNLLRQEALKGKKIAVLVNDFGALPVDGALLPKGDYHLAEINHGSIYCVCVKTNLLRDLELIANDIQPELLFIEATGAAEPRDFSALLGTESLKSSFKLVAALTVIDSLNFPKLSPILPALNAQARIADHLILNKTDMVTGDELNKLASELQDINPGAKSIHTIQGKIDWTDLELERECAIAPAPSELTLCPKKPIDTTAYEFRNNEFIPKTPFYELLEEYRGIILRAKGLIEFNEGESRYLEIVNGVVSAKVARDINFQRPTRNAMSFIMLEHQEFKTFIERLENLIS